MAIRAHLLGRLVVQLEDQSRVLLSGQIAEFLGYLAYRGDWVKRDEVIYLFWPDAPESVARRNLRKLLHRARQKVDGIEAEGGLLRWLVETDLQAWKDALERHDWLTASSHYRGALLEGFEGEGTGEYGAWLLSAREGCKRVWQEAFSDQANTSNAYPANAIPLFQRLFETDRLDEEVVQAYLHCLAGVGRVEDASRVYRAFRKSLREDLGIEPSEALQTLAETLEQRTNTAPAADVTFSGPERRARTREKTDKSATFLGNVRFVGRDHELSRLSEHLHAAQRGQGNALAVEGEAGVGKTRLVEEFLAAQKSLQVFRGRCFERELAAPLEPVRSALASLGELEVPPLVSSGRFWSADPSDRGSVHQGLTARLLRAAREQQGAVLFVDDVQWADAATLEFLAYAAKRVHGEPVLVLLSFRREDRKRLERWFLPLAERRVLEVIQLGRLGGAQLESLLSPLSTLKAADLNWLNKLLSHESEGNPFFAVEYLRWLHDKQVIELGADQRIITLKRENLTDTRLPAGVRTLLWARYQGLDEPARGALDLAAVIGRGFPFSLLETVSGRDPLDLWETVEPLVAAGLLSELPGEHYSLSHDKLRQTIYEGLGPPVKRTLHARVATALDAHGADPAELAHHYLRANAWADAFESLQSAARQAEEDFAWDVALQAYSRALDLCDRLPDADRKRFGLLQAKERLLENMDRRPERAAVVEQMTALAERLGDSALIAEAHLKRMAVRLRAGQAAEAQEAQDQAIKLFSDLGDTAGEARVYRELAYTAWTNSDYEAMLAANFEALRLYQALGNRRAEASTAWNIAQAYRRLDQPDEALEWAERAADMYEALTDLLGEYMRLDTLAWAQARRGETAVSAAYVKQLLPVCERLNDKHLSLEKHMTLGHHLLGAGELEVARAHFEAASGLGADTGDPRHEGYPLMSLGATLERLGELERAAQAYRRAAQLLETAYTVSYVADEQLAQADALTLLAGVLSKTEATQAALDTYQTAQVVFERHGAWPRLSKLLMERAALYWRQKDFKQSAHDYEKASRCAQKAALPEREAAALASLGVVLRDAGQGKKSVEASLKALGKLQALGDRQAEAYVLTSLAGSYRLLGKTLEAKNYLTASLELRHALGDAEGAARVSEELAALA